MKSKFTTYLLLGAVLVIWGIIVYRVFLSDDEQSVPEPRASVAAADNGAMDTLLLSYRDPFGVSREMPTPKPSANVVSEPVSAEPTAEPFNIRYVGTINHDKQSYYIVDLRGAQYTIVVGSEVGGFRLVAISDGKLHFTKNKRDYYLAL